MNPFLSFSSFPSRASFAASSSTSKLQRATISRSDHRSLHPNPSAPSSSSLITSSPRRSPHRRELPAPCRQRARPTNPIITALTLSPDPPSSPPPLGQPRSPPLTPSSLCCTPNPRTPPQQRWPPPERRRTPSTPPWTSPSSCPPSTAKSHRLAVQALLNNSPLDGKHLCLAPC